MPLVASTLASAALTPGTAQADATPVSATSDGQSSSRTSITLERPSGTEPGQVLVAAVAANGDSGAFTAPAGWSLVRDDRLGSALRQAVYTRVATDTEPSSYTWLLADWRRVAGGITAYAGVDTTTPVDAHDARLEPGAGTAVTAPSITTTMPGAMLVHVAAVNAEGTLTPPPGMAERWEATSPNPRNDRDVLVSSSDVPLPSAGPSGTRTVTASQAGPRIGVALALRPAAGPPPPDDTTPPDTTIDSGPTGTVNSDTATFTFSSDEAGSTFRCRLDAGTFEPCGSPRTYSGLADGPHEFAVAAVDPAGNHDETPATRQWTVAVPASTIEAVGSASSGSSSTRTSVTVNRPAGTEAGHAMVATVALNGDIDGIDAPAGWTLIRNDSAGDAVRQAVYTRVATDSEPGSYTWTLPGWRRIAAGITTYSGVSPTSPVEAHGAATSPGASTAVTAPSLTVGSANARLVHLAAVNVDGTITPPGGMDERFEARSPHPSKDRDILVALADGPLGTAGATGTRTATVAPAGPGIGAALALRPAGPPPPPPPPDTTAPDTFIDTGPSGTIDSGLASFTFSSDEAGVSFRCRLDGGSVEACSSPRSYSGLGNGEHTFEVAAVDAAGNVDATPASRTWTVALSADPVLVGAGDIASCSNNNDEATAQLLDAVVAAQPQARVFTAGDNVYPDGTDAEFANCYDPTWGRHKARTSPAPGNHDYNTPGASGYYGYFGTAAGDPDKGYYDYMAGDWHVVMLNSQCGAVGGCQAGSAQEQWLRARLAAVDAPCTAAIWHHPRFSSGSVHGANPTYGDLWQALHDHGAELVVNGHDHMYERFAPQTPLGALDPAFGIRQFTAGLGGRSLYNFGAVAPNSEFRYNADYGVLKLTLHRDGYDWEFLRVGGGAVIDSGTAGCHGAPTVEPPPEPGPITPVGSRSAGSASAQPALVVPRPSGLEAGHVMVANIVSNDSSPGFTTPAGWTLVRDHDAGSLRQAVYYRVATASEPASYTWALAADTTRRIAGGITAYRGVDPAHPIDSHGVSIQTDPSTAVSAPSITTSVADARLLHLAAVNAEGTISPPGGMAEQWEAASPNPRNSRDALAALADAPLGGAGATGGRTATASQAGRSIAVALALRPGGGPPPAPPSGPNIVVINTDDQRADGTLDVMPHTRAWLADGGTTFVNGYATSPVCCPSRSGLFSGRYTHNHGNLNNQTTTNLDQDATFQAYLKAAGYQTGMAGKFLLRWSNSTPPPNFDYWALTGGGYDNANYGTDQGPLTADYTTHETRRQALRMLDAFEADDRRPFLLYLAPQAPHSPFTAEAAYADADVGTWAGNPAVFETDRSDKGSWVRSWNVDFPTGSQFRTDQLRTLKSVDDMVDAVMNRLADLGELDETLVIFTSDNGYLWGEHGLRSKFLPYTESVHVPFLVRWPGKVAAGATDTRPVGNVDIAPSLLAAAGLSPDLGHPFDGRPFLSAGGLSSQVRPEAYLEYFKDGNRDFPTWRSIRRDTFQYIEWEDDSEQVIFREYYDLIGDPHQLTNLLADGDPANDPDLSAVTSRLARYRTCTGTAGPTACA